VLGKPVQRIDFGTRLELSSPAWVSDSASQDRLLWQVTRAERVSRSRGLGSQAPTLDLTR